MRIYDKKALKILLNYNVLEPGETTEADFAYAKAHGLMFDPQTVDHDQSVKQCLQTYATCGQQQVVAHFLTGIGQNRPELRTALSAYALMKHFPAHVFSTTTDYECAECAQPDPVYADYSFQNQIRFLCGSVLSGDPYDLEFVLREHLLDGEIVPAQTDVDCFELILNILRAADSKDTPTQFSKKLRKLAPIKLSVDQTRCLLELLGYAGILVSKKHPGPFTHYVNLGLAPSKTHSSDWAYPVDFWTGAEGVNEEAVAYWFGDYPQLLR